MHHQWHAWFVPPTLDTYTSKLVGTLGVKHNQGQWQPYPIAPGIEAWALPISPRVIDGALNKMLSTLVDVNVNYMQKHAMPLLYESGVYYQEETIGVEEWLAAPWVLTRGAADCEDLCAWRVAELRLAGETNARCYWTKKTFPDSVLYHIQVRRGNGQIEDPSALLGMGRNY